MKKYILWICNNTRNIVIKIYNRYLQYFSKSPNIKSIEDTIIHIVENRCSVSRFGDGELQIILGNGIRFQDRNLKLQNKLKEVIKSDESNHIVTLPDVFTKERLNLRTEENQKFWIKHLDVHRKDWYKNILKDKVYYNTALSRFYIPIKNKENSKKYINLLKQIWKNKKVVIIEGEKSRLGVGNDLFDNTIEIKRIICPPENAFEKYDYILKSASIQDKNAIILIALGPTATALAYDLYKLGYWSLDIGHIDLEYEWLNMGVKTQVKINHKYTNEAQGGSKVEDINDELYNSQIIKIIN